MVIVTKEKLKLKTKKSISPSKIKFPIRNNLANNKGNEKDDSSI